MKFIVPGPITGMKPGLPRINPASSVANPSPGPTMIEGRKTVQSSPDSRTAFSPAALVRPYSEGASGELPIALMWRNRRTPARFAAAATFSAATRCIRSKV
jgi:hypothetical protein